jgi:hypothetical protein
MADDSEDAPARAVRGDSSAAVAAWVAETQARAGQINFADYAAADPGAIFRGGYADDFAHEFVAQRALKIVVAAQDFDVRVADSRKAHADQCPTGF